MEPVHRIGFAIFCPILALLLHELTHIAVAKKQGIASIDVISTFPVFRLQLSYPDAQSSIGIRFMAVSPFIFGIFLAVGSIYLGLWNYITTKVPYYIEGILIMSWVAYSHLSPADVRTILSPRRKTAS